MATKRLYYTGVQVGPLASELDVLKNFDDRTLATLIGSGHRPLDEGHDDDQPLRTLPLERWRDR